MLTLTSAPLPQCRTGPADPQAPTCANRCRRVLILPTWYPWPDRPRLGSFWRDQADAVWLLHDAVVVTWRLNGTLTRPFVISYGVEDAVRMFRIQARAASRPRLETLWTVLAIRAVLARVMRSGWRADVVHARESQVNLPGIVATVVSQAPLIVSEHWIALACGGLARSEMDRASRFCRCAAVIRPVSHDLGRQIEPLIESTELRPMPNPVDTNFSSRGGREHVVRPRLLPAGSLTEINGHRIVIDAMVTLVRASLTVFLDFVGDGELGAHLEARPRECDVHHIKFHGRLSRREGAQMMWTAEVLVLPRLRFVSYSRRCRPGARWLPAVSEGPPRSWTRLMGARGSWVRRGVGGRHRPSHQRARHLRCAGHAPRGARSVRS